MLRRRIHRQMIIEINCNTSLNVVSLKCEKYVFLKCEKQLSGLLVPLMNKRMNERTSERTNE